MKTWRRTLAPLLLLAGLTILTVLTAPAELLTRQLAAYCQEQCRFAEVDGYWWQGQARLYLQTGRVDRAWQSLGLMRWHPDGAGLQLDMAGGTLRLYPSGAGLALEIDGIRLPAGALLSHLGHGLPSHGWGGELEAKTVRWSKPWFSGQPSLQGDLLWHQASSALLENQPLGDYRLHWKSGSDTPGQGELTTQHGPLRLDGKLTANPFRFDGQARLEEGGKPLAKYLNMLARPDGPDSYRISLPERR